MGDDTRDLQDELIVIRCQVGERSALDDLVARWHLPLWRFIRQMVDRHDQAEEAVQETWVRVLRGLPGLRDPARFTPWFYAIARRVLMNRLRAKYAAPPEDANPMESAAHDEATPLDAEEVSMVHEKLHALPLIEREALTLFYIGGLSIEELAEVAGVPEGTVKSRLHRARRLLRAAMEQTGELS